MASKRPKKSKGEEGFSLRERLVGVDKSTEALVPLAKAYFVGEDSGSQSNAIAEQDKTSNVFQNSGAVPPIYDPTILALIFENSSALRQNVDAYITNIDSFGHHFVPVLDLTAEDVDERIRDALRAERRYAKKNTTDVKAQAGLVSIPDEPSDEEIKARKAELLIEMRAELCDLEAFFSNCTPTMPFSGPEGLRGLTRQDIEVFGNGYWEVIRNQMKDVSQFNRLEARSVRLMPVDESAVSSDSWRKVSALKSVKVSANKRFRTYVQRYEGSAVCVFYKEFGDPRITSAKTGKKFATVDEMSTKEKHTQQATEIIPFKITSVRSIYGAPRWIGALLAVLGTRQSEEVNFLYFENRSIPPMVIIVSGGRLNKDSVKRLEDHIENKVKGKRNFHKTMIIEGEASGSNDGTGPNNGKMKIELKPLTGAQQQDALFQQYDERNADKVGQTFRLPRLLRGDVRDFNRSTAEASVDFAEIQVFGPIRQQFDWMVNTMILPALNIQYHSFKSNAPTVRDPEALATIIAQLMGVGVLTPEEARALARGCFNEELPKIKEPWTKQPLAITLAGRLDTSQGTVDEGDASTEVAAPSAKFVLTPSAQGSIITVNEARATLGLEAMSGDRAADGAMTIAEFQAKHSLVIADAANAESGQGKGDEKPEEPDAKARALLKIHKMFLDEERAEWKKSKKSAGTEKLVIPQKLFSACFTPEGE